MRLALTGERCRITIRGRREYIGVSDDSQIQIDARDGARAFEGCADGKVQ